MNFVAFRTAVAKQFELMQKHSLFRVDVDKDELYETYLESFPAGTNEVYRERTSHDCSCCKNYVRDIGNVVALIDGKLHTIWDVKLPAEETAYQHVADELAARVKSGKLVDKFLHYQTKVGQIQSFEDVANGTPKKWDHFFSNIDRKHVRPNADIGTELSKVRSGIQVFHRALDEMSIEAVDEVLDLISQGSLYRGEENKFLVEEFRKHKVVYDSLAGNKERKRNVFTWVKGAEATSAVLHFRSSSIGKLVSDLSEGMDLEKAVKLYEDKVSGTNYKRPTALVTPRMIEAAKAKVEELGLTSALQRRYATLADISINNILFADRSVKSKMADSVFDALVEESPAAVNPKSFDKVETMPIAEFIEKVLPRAKSVEVLLENRHSQNFMSLVAPVDPTAGRLFNWDNNFSWSYTGEVADSIKERVKRAGGSVEGDLCCRLAWDYDDDLDFHMYEPGYGHISYVNRRRDSPNGGQLDVDANGADGRVDEPCENIYYADKRRMASGTYRLSVHNYRRAQTEKKGFEVEIEFDGVKHNLIYPKTLREDERVEVAVINYNKATGAFTLTSALKTTTKSKTVWGLPSMMFHRVNVLMMSPNHWDGQGTGNRHYFFMLQGATPDQPARGFYNEFLNPQMHEHRKVLEMVGSRTKVAETPDALAGLGFSTTQRAELVVRVRGAVERVLKLTV